jgi:thioester reductase-like protein
MSLASEQTQTVFITGATGNIGGKLAADILLEHPETHVALLIRGDSEAMARRRAVAAIRCYAPQLDSTRLTRRVSAIHGDICRSQLGLVRDAYEILAERVTHVIHAAAATQFHLPFECAFEANHLGTEQVLRFAKQARARGRLRGLAYISTAYVCGDRQGLVAESELCCGQGFANSYEKTKYLSELLVQRHAGTLPLTIFRPSIVVGDSRSGSTITFNVLYVPLKLICQGLVTEMPGEPRATLDIVPVDFVSRAVRHLSLDQGRFQGETFHLAGGPQRTVTVEEIIRPAVCYFQTQVPGGRIKYVDTLGSARVARKDACSRYVRRVLQLYKPYTSAYRWFDDSAIRAALAGTGIEPPAVSDYLLRVLAHCEATHWGRGVRLAA